MSRTLHIPVALTLISLAATVCAAAPLTRSEVDLKKGLKNAIVGTDPKAEDGKCIVLDVTKLRGTAFAVGTIVQPGVYDAVLSIKLPKISSVNTAPLAWKMTVKGAGKGEYDFDILRIEKPNTYQDIACRFVANRHGRATFTLSWERRSLGKDHDPAIRVEAKDMPTLTTASILGDDDVAFDDLELEAEFDAEPPIGGLKYLYTAIDHLKIVPVSDVDISKLEVDRIRYKPGEKAKVSLDIRNCTKRPRSLKVETVFINGLDTIIPVDSRTLELAPRARQYLAFEGPPFEAKWGYAVRCIVLEDGAEIARKEEYFTVHDNMWAVCINGRGAAQFTAHVNQEGARRAALRNKQRYRNWVESGFWAPDEFGDFTPDTEKWWGGQGCYYGSVSGTKVQIEEGHKLGISYAVYANIWGGDGPPAFEMIRRRPDWGYPSTFDTEWFENWDSNPMGTGSGKTPMHVWPITIINHSSTEEPARHHGRELIEAHRTLGWDAVRYDSHAISDRNAAVMKIVKAVVRAEEPDFQFGYNSSVPAGNKSKIEAFKAECEGEGLIMEEGIRQFGGGGMSHSGGKTYEVFARRILNFKNEAREHGGHFIAIGMDNCYPNDLLYQYIFWLAANTHTCYDWRDSQVANYLQFATRFAGLIWDLNVTPVSKPEEWLDMGEAGERLWLWKDYVHQRDLGDGRRQLIIHLINTPAEKNLYTHDDGKVPPPMENLQLSLRLPGAASVRGVWFLTPEYELTRKRLEYKKSRGRVSFTVPRVRFWSTAVVDLENAEAFD